MIYLVVSICSDGLSVIFFCNLTDNMSNKPLCEKIYEVSRMNSNISQDKFYAEFNISFYTLKDISDSPDLLEKWYEFIDKAKKINNLYQSPVWFEHLSAAGKATKLFLAVARNVNEQIAGFVPLILDNFNLKFDVYAYTIFRIPLKAVFILGSEPIFPENETLYVSFINAIWEKFPEYKSIYMDNVLSDSFFYETACNYKDLQKRAIIHIPDGLRAFHLVNLPLTFDEYLSNFKNKKRYNLKRQVKTLRQYGEGRLELVRIVSTEQVQEFIDGAVTVAKKSWQHSRIGPRIENSQQWKDKLHDMAKRSILRSYLLKCNEIPCAFVYGYQYRDVYHYAEIAYDESYAKYSPGTVLLYLLMEDLTSVNAVDIVNFGIGDALYKQEFGNVHSEDMSILLVRKTLLNTALMLSHKSFKLSISLMKRLINRFRKK
jgi:CelD/BcsL family acetyltransferase involved in cellulose biosynthesis